LFFGRVWPLDRRRRFRRLSASHERLHRAAVESKKPGELESCGEAKRRDEPRIARSHGAMRKTGGHRS
jgi:hypothetical protein